MHLINNQYVIIHRLFTKIKLKNIFKIVDFHCLLHCQYYIDDQRSFIEPTFFIKSFN